MSKKTKAKKRRAATRVERLFPPPTAEETSRREARLSLHQDHAHRDDRKRKARTHAKKVKAARVDKNPLVVLAEAAMTQKEIQASMASEAAVWLEENLASQKDLVAHLDRWLNQFDFAGFSRKKTVDRAASRAIRRWRGA